MSETKTNKPPRRIRHYPLKLLPLLKNILTCAVIALVVSSCIMDEPTEYLPMENSSCPFSNPIVFNTATSQTRAHVIDSESLKEGFGIYAYTSEDSFSPQEFHANFMYNQKIFNNGSGWEYTPLKYWSSTKKKTSFLAYAPYQPTSSTMLSYASNTTLRYNLPTDVSSQIDLCYGSSIDADGIESKTVNLNFEHALSRVAFSAKTDLSYEQLEANMQIRIDKITVESIGSNTIYTSGKLSLDTGDWYDLTQSEATFTLTEENFNFTTATQEEGLLTDADSYLMLIPQRSATKIYGEISTVNPVDWKILVESTIIDQDGTEHENNVYAVCSDVIFTQGYGYQISLTIGANSLKVNINEGDWNQIDQNEWFAINAYQEEFHIAGVIPNMGRDDAVYTVKSLYDPTEDAEYLLREKTLYPGEFTLDDSYFDIGGMVRKNRCYLKIENNHGQQWSLPIKFKYGYMQFTIQIYSTSTDKKRTYVLPVGKGEQPATLVIQWGDGTYSHEIRNVDDTNNFHLYESTGTYPIRILTTQNNYDLPQIKFFMNGVEDENRDEVPEEAPYNTAWEGSYLLEMPFKIISLDTPLLHFAMPCHSIFTSCTNLQKVNQNLYRYNPQLTDCSYAFLGCVNLQRAPELWNLPQFTRHVSTFSKCFPSNFSSIPSSWF